ncbi:hypothetical protein R1A27_17010 [Methylobacterium sp. NMS12]|uniref:hypothetical protein n=1 Tax=Methylobacterium sp. NMS12 TaxID=3079766 RepID=UPI003F884C45
MTIDLKRLRRDLVRRQADRPAGRAPSGRTLTGAMAVVRALLPELTRLRAAGLTWPEIAAGLAAQGVVQTRGEHLVPITGRRVSALVASLRRQELSRRRAAERRASRSDLALPTLVAGSRPSPSARLHLAADLTSAAPAPPDAPLPVSEEALRRAALASVKDILKKDHQP